MAWQPLVVCLILSILYTEYSNACIFIHYVLCVYIGLKYHLVLILLPAWTITRALSTYWPMLQPVTHIIPPFLMVWHTQSFAFDISLKASQNLVQFPEHYRSNLCLSHVWTCTYTQKRCWLLEDLSFKRKTHATNFSLCLEKGAFRLSTLTWLDPQLMYHKMNLKTVVSNTSYF